MDQSMVAAIKSYCHIQIAKTEPTNSPDPSFDSDKAQAYWSVIKFIEDHCEKYINEMAKANGEE